jgi:hypothetical protein
MSLSKGMVWLGLGKVASTMENLVYNYYILPEDWDVWSFHGTVIGWGCVADVSGVAELGAAATASGRLAGDGGVSSKEEKV